MSADTEQNKAATLAFYEKALNQRDADAALEYVGAHYKQHNPLIDDDYAGLWSLEGRKRAMEAWYVLSMPLFDTEDAQAALHGAADAVAAGKPYPRAPFVGR
jgi:hypothetical protein